MRPQFRANANARSIRLRYAGWKPDSCLAGNSDAVHLAWFAVLLPLGDLSAYMLPSGRPDDALFSNGAENSFDRRGVFVAETRALGKLRMHAAIEGRNAPSSFCGTTIGFSPTLDPSVRVPCMDYAISALKQTERQYIATIHAIEAVPCTRD